MSVDGDLLEYIASAIHAVGLDAVVVGNTASELHGAPVLTEDVDLLVRDTPLNRKKIVQLAEELGGSTPVDINDLVNAKRFYLVESNVDIIFGKTAKLTFNAAKSRSEKIRVGRHTLQVASLQDVIRSKEAAGRAKDLAVLPILRDTLAVKKARK